MSFICGPCQFAGVNSGRTLETEEGFPEEGGLGHTGKDAGVGNNVLFVLFVEPHCGPDAEPSKYMCSLLQPPRGTCCHVPPFTEETAEVQR